VSALRSLLSTLNDEYKNPQSSLQRLPPTRQGELAARLDECKSDLREVRRILRQYQSLDSNDPRFRDRLAFTTGKQAALRERLSTHSGRIQQFLNGINLATFSKIERNTEAHLVSLSELKARLDQIHHDLLSGRRDPSVLDDDQLSAELEEELLGDDMTEAGVDFSHVISEWLDKIRHDKDVCIPKPSASDTTADCDASIAKHRNSERKHEHQTDSTLKDSKFFKTKDVRRRSCDEILPTYQKKNTPTEPDPIAVERDVSKTVAEPKHVRTDDTLPRKPKTNRIPEAIHAPAHNPRFSPDIPIPSPKVGHWVDVRETIATKRNQPRISRSYDDCTRSWSNEKMFVFGSYARPSTLTTVAEIEVSRKTLLVGTSQRIAVTRKVDDGRAQGREEVIILTVDVPPIKRAYPGVSSEILYFGLGNKRVTKTWSGSYKTVADNVLFRFLVRSEPQYPIRPALAVQQRPSFPSSIERSSSYHTIVITPTTTAAIGNTKPSTTASTAKPL
jgi:hypothetical protein